MKQPILRVALPSKGRLEKETLEFLDGCALRVRRENERQYQARMTGIDEGIEVIFQRAADIPKIVGEGRIDLGITGFDLLWEKGAEAACISVFPDERDENLRKVDSLPYGSCSLVIAIQEHWVHVTNIADLAELAVIHKKRKDILKVATEFPNLTRKFLFDLGVTHFEIIAVSGAAESAPRTKSAAFVSTLKSSGVTLSENRLKEIEGGIIISSGACLIASSQLAKEGRNSTKLELARNFIDRIEAHMIAEDFVLVTANIVVNKPDAGEEQLRTVLSEGLTELELKLLGQEGPTVAKVIKISKEGKGQSEQNNSYSIYSVSIQVKRENLDKVIAVLRKKSGQNILVSPLNFVFDDRPKAFARLSEKLHELKSGN